MKIKSLFKLSILSSFLIVGCDSDPASASSESYTLNDLEGTWESQSSNFEMVMVLDIALAIESMDEDECIGEYDSSDGCIVDSASAIAYSLVVCELLEGSLNGTQCSVAEEGETIFSEQDSQTITILSDGSMSILNIDSEGEETLTGNISVNGNMIAWQLDDNPEMPGTISISEDIATLQLSAEGDEFMAILAGQDEGNPFSDALISGSTSTVIVMNKVTF